MIKLTKAKRDQLVMVAIGTVAAVVGLWYLGVQTRQDTLVATINESQKVGERLGKAEALVRGSKEVEALLEERNAELLKREMTLLSMRDPMGWVLKTIKPFFLTHKGVKGVNFNPPEMVDASPLPKFRYKTAVVQVRGSGSYDQIGKLIADFENSYPYFRVQALDLNAASEGETLSFRFDIIMLIRPADSEADKP